MMRSIPSRVLTIGRKREFIFLEVDANTNKFSNTTDYELDAVGNLIRDIHGRQFSFNGDNKQVEVRNGASQVVGG